MLPRAMNVAREWIARYPTNPSPRAALAFIQREQQQWTDSIQTCSAAIEKLPETEATMTLLDIRANNYYTLGDYEQAAKDFEKVKSLSAKGLARFAVDKPQFLTINECNPRYKPAPEVPRGRPDILKRQKEESRRVMELYSLFLAENPQMQPQTAEELEASKGVLSRAQTPARVGPNSSGMFMSLMHTVRANMQEEARKTRKVLERNYEVREEIGRFCAMCHKDHSFTGDEGVRKPQPNIKKSPKRLMHRSTIGQLL